MLKTLSTTLIHLPSISLAVSTIMSYINMIVVPDDILETLVCDFCHKYLSVKPVGVVNYDNQSLKICGRCIPNKKEAIISHMYGYFAENAIFKCLYSFNGCKRLLHWDEVKQHEQKCLFVKDWNFYSKKCFICESEYGSIDMLKKHLTISHDDTFVGTPIIKNTLRESEKWQYFIYTLNNDTFVVFCKFKRRDCVFLLKAFRVDDCSENKDVIITLEVTIEHEILSRVLKFQSTAFRTTVTVIHEVEQLLIVGNPLVIVKLDFTYSNLNLSRITELKEDCIDKYRKLRKIQPMQNLPTTVKLSNCQTKLITKDLEGKTIIIIVECVLCSKISSDNLFITNNGQQRNFLCKQCCLAYKSNYADITICTYNVINFIKFFCIWDCGLQCDFSRIDEHELICKNAPLQDCPICVNFAAPFENMKLHLWEYHKKKVVLARTNIHINIDILKTTLFVLNGDYVKFDNYGPEGKFVYCSPFKHFRHVSVVFKSEKNNSSRLLDRTMMLMVSELPGMCYFIPEYVL